MRLLALDFDGVISDSAPEAFVVALRTWLDLVPGSSLRDRTQLESDGAPERDAVAREPLWAGFLAQMPLGNRAEDYGVVLAALECAAELPDQAAYDEFYAGRDAAWLRTYHRRFYQVRHALADADPAGWRRLLGPYPALLEVLRRRAGEVVYAVATAKDRRSVRMLLRDYGIDDLFDESLVLDKEAGVSKDAHLEHLHRSQGFAFPEMTFVDDKLNHLDRVAPLGVRCGLAGWGYNGPREERQARERGYQVLALDGLEQQLFGSSAGRS
jgi:phosphoglycolate phosphatase-like HAD superfamily hydrolase